MKQNITLIKEFPKGKFELQQQNDITREGYHKLYINIFVDDETFENGFMNGIHRVPSKIIPLKKELNLMMKLVLMPGGKRLLKIEFKKSILNSNQLILF